MKFGIRVFFENLSLKLKFHLNLTKLMGSLHETLCVYICYLVEYSLE